uniref:Early nodulin-like 2 predicted GPI-anchored protein n=1 Tax=Solanum tuberosum TaxID=4113 RepID=M1DUF6_SOLTU
MESVGPDGKTGSFSSSNEPRAVFKFELGSNSALFVYKEYYYNCNKEDPIVILDHVDSRFTFHGPGTFSFISGHEDNCEKGQKLMIVVLSPNHTKAQEAQTSLSPTPAESVGQFYYPPRFRLNRVQQGSFLGVLELV